MRARLNLFAHPAKASKVRRLDLTETPPRLSSSIAHKNVGGPPVMLIPPIRTLSDTESVSFPPKDGDASGPTRSLFKKKPEEGFGFIASPSGSLLQTPELTASIRLEEPVMTVENVEPGKVRERRLAILKRSGLFSDDTKGARVARAGSLEDLRKAYKLVHDVYLGTGFIQPEPSGMRLRIFETTSETATFVAKINGRVVGVLSIVGDSPELGLPSDSAFKPELDFLRANGTRLCEATNQAVAEEFRKSAVPTELMRCAVAHMITVGYDKVMAAVSPSHHSFYELLNFRQIGSERSYSGKIHDPVVALGMDINQYRHHDGHSNDFIYQFLAEQNHYLVYVGEWARQAQQQFLNADLLQQLFVTERNFLAECSPEELRFLHRRWGRELFAVVTGDLFLPACDEVVAELPVAQSGEKSTAPGAPQAARRGGRSSNSRFSSFRLGRRSDLRRRKSRKRVGVSQC